MPADNLAASLERIRPAELLLPGIPRLRAPSRRRRHPLLPDWHFDGDSARRLLCEHFRVASLGGFGADGLRPAVAAAGALLHYARETQSGTPPHVQSIAVEVEADYLGLDAATRRNLELTETLRGQPAPTLFSLLDRCITGMGSRLLRHALHHPCATACWPPATRRWMP